MTVADPRIEKALDEVLSEGRLTEHFNYTGPSDRMVPADEVREQVRQKIGQTKGLAGLVDAAVEARGGEKLEMIDPGEKVRNLSRRLIGHSPEPNEDMYHFPG